MLPQRKMDGDVFAVPEFVVEKTDIEGFIEELRGFHSEFSGCFRRSELREHFFQYMVGQFSKLERKSIEPIACSVENGNVRQMQRFLSDAVWDEEKILAKYRSMVNNDLGDDDGVLIFDESGFPKKGADSAGVARQYCGTLGKVDNCQVGVFCAYASRHGYALLDKQLFLPEKWFSDEYAQRRKNCAIPKETEFKTKPQLAAQMFSAVAQEGTLPFKYVVADTVYGNSPEFIDALESYSGGAVYFLAVSCDTLCFSDRPATTEREYKYRGEPRVRRILQKGSKNPVRIDELARDINAYFWYRRRVSEGTKGPIEYQFARRRVILCKDGLPDREVTLVVKRTLGENPVYSYYISNASASTRLKIFVWLSGMRWAIEQCFEETKSELGMDQYEVRKYPGWCHHILSCMLAHFFLWHLRIALGEKSTGYYAVAA